jgi:hypothetical protein
MKYLFFILTAVLVFSCKNERTPDKEPLVLQGNELEAVKEMLDKQAEREASGFDFHDVIGFYVGDFVAQNLNEAGNPINKINIAIDSLINTSIYGHTIIAGNSRFFEGSIDLTSLEVKVQETEDHPNSGDFMFIILPDGQSLSGVWQTSKKDSKVAKRSYKLFKKTFKYDPNIELPKDIEWKELYTNAIRDEYLDADDSEILTDGILQVNPSNTKLKNEDLENMHKGDLEVLKNSIYARHGYSFKNKKMRYVFDRVNWYIPFATEVKENLTALEKSNIELIKKFEQHAKAYYDNSRR